MFLFILSRYNMNNVLSRDFIYNILVFLFWVDWKVYHKYMTYGQSTLIFLKTENKLFNTQYKKNIPYTSVIIKLAIQLFFPALENLVWIKWEGVSVDSVFWSSVRHIKP